MEHVAVPSLLNKNIVKKSDNNSLIIHSIDLTSHYHNQKVLMLSNTTCTTKIMVHDDFK